jgi:ATP-binding cassette subfamily B protein
MARRPLPPEGKPAKSLGPLRMIWREALKYRGRVTIALLALLAAAIANLMIPVMARQIIDRAFGKHADLQVINHSFETLMMIVAAMALASAMRFYSVSWLGERVVADIRLAVQDNLLRLSPGFFEENSPKEISSRMTADTAIIDQVVGTTISVALRNVIIAIGGVAYLFYLAPWQSAF